LALILSKGVLDFCVADCVTNYLADYLANWGGSLYPTRILKTTPSRVEAGEERGKGQKRNFLPKTGNFHAIIFRLSNLLLIFMLDTPPCTNYLAIDHISSIANCTAT
jgi:hypothetical protein